MLITVCTFTVLVSMDRGFVDRDAELERLRQRYRSENAELVVVYGRRRMGKSALVRQSLDGVDGTVVYQAAEVTPDLQLERFAETAAATYPEAAQLRPGWERLLAFLGERDAVIVVDEFPYVVQADESIPSRFQRAWDQHLEGTRATLVLVGSSISVMEDHVLAGKSPLYGRRTGTIDLGPLPVAYLGAFIDDLSAEETVMAWSLFGGSPHALRALDPTGGLQGNVQRVLLDEQGLLHDEPELLLRAELREPNTYFSLLRAIARGRTRRNEIAQAAGVRAETISSYLSRLRRLRVVEREVPATEDPTRSRRGRYRISDPLFRTWFRFVHGNQVDLSRLGEHAFEQIVEPELADHASLVFETLAHEALPMLGPGPYRRLGRWWFREHELDVAGLTVEGREVLGECKFTKRPVHRGDLADLEATAEHVQWPGEAPSERSFVLFSRSGFTDDLASEADRREELSLFDVGDVVQALEQAAKAG